MKTKVTDNSTLIEQRINQYPHEEKTYFSRYKSSSFIPDDIFAKAIQSMGGYTYNTCVGVVGSIKVFNGYTWTSVESNSYAKNDEVLKQLERKLIDAGWEQKPVEIQD